MLSTLRPILSLFSLWALLSSPALADQILLNGAEQPISGTVLECNDSFLSVEILDPSSGPTTLRIPVDRLDPHYHYVIRARIGARGNPTHHLELSRLCQRLSLTRLAYEEALQAIRLARHQQKMEVFQAATIQSKNTSEQYALTLFEEGQWRRSFGRWEEARPLLDRILIDFGSTPSAILAATELADMERRKQARSNRLQQRLAKRQNRVRSTWERALEWAMQSIEEARKQEDNAYQLARISRSSRLRQVDLLLASKATSRLRHLHQRARSDSRRGSLPEWVDNELDRLGQQIREMRVRTWIELAWIYLERGSTSESSRWVTRVLQVDPDHTEAKNIRLQRVLVGLDRDPSRMPKGLLTRLASRLVSVSGATQNAVENRLTPDEIASINATRAAAGLNPLPGP